MSGNAPKKSSDGDVEMDMVPDTKSTPDASGSADTTSRQAAPVATVVSDPRPVDVAYGGLKRSIALALDHVGFDAADAEAIESFTLAAEEYLASLLGVLKRQALSARREQPTPVDFEKMLRTFNLPVDSLKPHVRHPVLANRLVPKTKTIPAPDGPYLRPLPTLSEELSGKPEKESKEYIPSLFPDFPSRHTFVSTPREETQSKKDPNAMREHISKAAKQGEDALRGLLRASKVRQQKEVRSQAQRYPASRERYRLWEQAMEKMMKPQDGQLAPQDDALAKPLADRIANASMIVNSSTDTLRREGVRTTRRPAGRTIATAEPAPK
ncbi:hypothetical protein jhhlp_006031 [Lomentospora prolificans]|uniref:Transcription initiation factor TFIID subunit 8 n=1 Tax=Lomentospora prolificans TaxID=41688 RepID=A0A2N3N4S5_9PEZI|nr:hypothetical protein jhhlp_006031 [Lomentospora prolificans]